VATEAGITRVEAKELSLIFTLEKADIELWAELLGKYKQLSMRATTPIQIIYRLKPGEDPTYAAATVMTDYFDLMTAD
jgi:hypothetical protein